MLGQRTAERLRSHASICFDCGLGLFDGTGRLELFQLQLQLLDLADHLLTLRTEEHAPQLLDQQNQARDLGRAGTQPGGVSLMVRKQQRLQRSRIKSIQIGQAEGLGRVRSMSRNRHANRKKSRVNTGESLKHSSPVLPS